MSKRVGIPRGMLYYDYYPQWEKFFKDLEFEVVYSPKTNKDILNAGILNSVDESCLPVKLYHGHVEYLKDKVDYLFIPKFISIYKREYCCPKLLGLPDMVKHSIKDLPTILSPKIDLSKRDSFKKEVLDLGKILNINKQAINRAFKNSWRAHIDNEGLDTTKKISDLEQTNILVLGHVYNVYDEFLNMGIIEKLKSREINILFAEDVNEDDVRNYSNSISKRMFWTHGRRIMGSAYSLIENNNLNGIIYLSSFGCGLDSVLVHLVSRKAQEYSVPFLLMTLDEQTGEAGFNTRLEAFLDMLEWRVNNENNISSFR